MTGKGDGKADPGKNFNPAKTEQVQAPEPSEATKGPSWGAECRRENRTGAQNDAAAKSKQSNPIDKSQHKDDNTSAPNSQKNNPIYPEATFGPDVILREINQVVEFTPTFAHLPEINRLIYARRS